MISSHWSTNAFSISEEPRRLFLALGDRAMSLKIADVWVKGWVPSDFDIAGTWPSGLIFWRYAGSWCSAHVRFFYSTDTPAY